MGFFEVRFECVRVCVCVCVCVCFFLSQKTFPLEIIQTILSKPSNFSAYE